MAQAELAYDLQTAKTKQDITKEQVQIDIVERRKLVDIEDKEILRFVKIRNFAMNDLRVNKPQQSYTFIFYHISLFEVFQIIFANWLILILVYHK